MTLSSVTAVAWQLRSKVQQSFNCRVCVTSVFGVAVSTEMCASNCEQEVTNSV